MAWVKAIGWLIVFLAFALVIIALSFLGAHLIVREATVLPSDAGWAQAIGAVLSILVGFGGVLYQVGRSKADAIEQMAERGRAAHLVAFDALETLTERLRAMLIPNRSYKNHRLRGERTNEMIAAMRELDTSTLPSSILADFIRFRSRAYAINQRITEIYTGEEKGAPARRKSEKARRRSRLNSSIEVWKEAVGYFENMNVTAVALGAESKSLTKPVEISGYIYPGDGA